MLCTDAQDSVAIQPSKLKRRAQLFVSEYLKDLNGTQAAIRAGYSPSAARRHASRMLSNVDISTAIRQAQDKILKKNHVTVSRIVRELALIAFFDPASLYDESGRLLDINELPPEVRHSLPSFEIVKSPTSDTRRLRFGGKLAALLALAKHMSMFTDRIGEDPSDLPPFDPSVSLDDEIDDESSSVESELANG